jgi:hypothetical protein
MIKGRIQTSNGATLLLGLSRENCNRLLDDKPILITSAMLVELGLPGVTEIVLVAGETEEQIVADMDNAGVMGHNIKDTPPPTVFRADDGRQWRSDYTPRPGQS